MTLTSVNENQITNPLRPGFKIIPKMKLKIGGISNLCESLTFITVCMTPVSLYTLPLAIQLVNDVLEISSQT